MSRRTWRADGHCAHDRAGQGGEQSDEQGRHAGRERYQPPTPIYNGDKGIRISGRDSLVTASTRRGTSTIGSHLQSAYGRARPSQQTCDSASRSTRPGRNAVHHFRPWQVSQKTAVFRYTCRLGVSGEFVPHSCGPAAKIRIGFMRQRDKRVVIPLTLADLRPLLLRDYQHDLGLCERVRPRAVEVLHDVRRARWQRRPASPVRLPLALSL